MAAPEGQGRLFELHHGLMSSADAYVQAAALAPQELRDLVPYALWARLIQVARAAEALMLAGYAEEAKPLCRAALSTTVAMKLICVDDLRGQDGPEANAAMNATGKSRTALQAESDGRALQYITHLQQIRHKQNRGFLRRGWVDEGRLGEVEQHLAQEDAATLAGYAQHGVTPRKLGGNDLSWHGLSEIEAFERVGVGEWYDLYYRNFSEESHASEPAIRDELDRLIKRAIVSTGPKFAEPYVVLRADVDSVGSALLSFSRHLGFGRPQEIRQMVEPLVNALTERQTSMSPAVFRSLFT